MLQVKKYNSIFLDLKSNPIHWTQSPALYRIAVKASLYSKAVQVCYIPIHVPGDNDIMRVLIRIASGSNSNEYP